MSSDLELLILKPSSKERENIIMTSEERREVRYIRRCEKRRQKKERLLRFDNFEWVFSYEHLYEAYKKCKRNVRWKASTQSYIDLAPLKVFRTYEKLRKGKFRSKGFFEFDIIERGKKRHIRSVLIDERVVQRCLCDYCLVPLLSRTFIYDNGASLKNKGYHFARKRVVRFLQRFVSKNGTNGYVLLFDFSQFFDNISHSLCKRILRENVTDKRIIKLVDHFIDMFGDIGLGLGSQISQIFALVSANRLDHYIKEVLRIKNYERYMDDGCLIHESKTYLQKCVLELSKLCRKYGIILNKKKTKIVKLSHGFTWLKTKFNISPSNRILKRLVRKSTRIMRRKLKSFSNFVDNGRMSLFDVYTSYQSWRSYARKFDSNRTIQNMEHLFLNLYGCTSKMASQTY